MFAGLKRWLAEALLDRRPWEVSPGPQPNGDLIVKWFGRVSETDPDASFKTIPRVSMRWCVIETQMIYVGPGLAEFAVRLEADTHDDNDRDPSSSKS